MLPAVQRLRGRESQRRSMREEDIYSWDGEEEDDEEEGRRARSSRRTVAAGGYHDPDFASLADVEDAAFAAATAASELADARVIRKERANEVSSSQSSMGDADMEVERADDAPDDDAPGGGVE